MATKHHADGLHLYLAGATVSVPQLANDFAVTAMLLSQDNQTMVPKIASFMGTTQTEGNVMFAVAAVVSAVVPLFMV